MIVETERLILRPFAESDRPANAAIFADPQVRRFSLGVLDRAAADARLEEAMRQVERQGFGVLAVEHRADRACIGMIGFTGFDAGLRGVIPSHPQLQLVWQLDRRYWGQGLAPEGAAALLPFAWDELHAPEVVAITARINLPSQRVMHKIGMTAAPADDFDHPRLPVGHELRPHVLYRIENPGAAAGTPPTPRSSPR
ncbi:MAG TPA: GNAT family N-acetyltransferase [Devosia sp.]|nr:GNAT family N-acetyltransferase [Devosia sp.]